MRTRALPVAALLITACFFSSSCSSANKSATGATSRSYHGTASVGDFMNITVDTVAHTISYTNLSNGDTGNVPYTENSPGNYTLSDPSGNLVAAYEIPGYAMLIEAQKAGSDQATPSLVTAVAQTAITLGTFENNAYNYMQFRTAAGGFESGSAILDGQGNVAVSSYWPYGGTLQNSSPFNNHTMPSSGFSEDPSGTFLHMADQGGTDYVFGTPQGFFIVDTGNGAILGMKKSAGKNFDPHSPAPIMPCTTRKLMPRPAREMSRLERPASAAQPS